MGAARDITSLLHDVGAGRDAAIDELLPLVYDQLRELAARHFSRERPDHTLQPTALVHEAYLRLVDQTRAQWNDRAHFMAVSAVAIRRVLVDHARRRGAAKRGAGRERIATHAVHDQQELDVLVLEDALQTLAQLDARKARIVELRFYGGLTIEETAEVLEVSHATVERDWRMARAWLQKTMSDED